MSKNIQQANMLICNFCEKAKNEVNKLIVADGAAICNECIETCSGIITNEKYTARYKKSGIFKSLDPLRVKKYLDEFIIGQDSAKEAISVAIINHYKRLFYNTTIELEKSNVLLHGPTGNGKTMLARIVAKFLEVPFVVCDATTLTEAGYIGEDSSSVIERLLMAADGDLEHAERGIIFIDEIDKIGRVADAHGSVGRDVGGEGVQQSLLKILEGGDIKVSYNDGNHKEEIDFNTKDVLFIAAGAFPDLQKIASNNANKGSTIGFASTIPDPNQVVTPKITDFVQYGMIPEFMGRFPITIQVKELTDHEMRRVLTEPRNNLIKQYFFYFDVDGVKLEFSHDAIDAVIELTAKEKIGARGLRAIIEKVLHPHMFNLRNLKNSNVKKLTITADTVLKQQQPILEYHDERGIENDTIELGS